MEAITDPSTPVCFPGGGGFFSFTAAGSSSREGEAFSAPSSPVLAPEGRGSYSSTLSVLVPVLKKEQRLVNTLS
ncbi:hypothetical protein F2Q68_00008932 [Brassica cretica]|uniref:Uncharacterized protein n=1 Tax=Brassica cretica TaxID=69181 RepID=A0A8S9KRU1_BRACR|nr:hypothetical protein F2Q68_00008932 [Brassica cretica]